MSVVCLPFLIQPRVLPLPAEIFLCCRAYPTERNLLMSAQFLHKELPVRLAHRVTELEQLPYGLSAKAPVLKVSMAAGTGDWCGRWAWEGTAWGLL